MQALRDTAPSDGARPSAGQRGSAFARALWALLLALHLWPLAKVTTGLVAGQGGWLALAGLLATQALFAAKLADVRWLRLPSRRAAVVVFLLATALAHPEAALQELGQATKGAAVATVAAAPAVLRARPRRWFADWLRRGAHAVDLGFDRAGRMVRPERAVALVPLSVRALRPGRAPPARPRA